MKRAGNLIIKVADPDNIRLAAWKAAKGKRHSADTMHWFAYMDSHLEKLQAEILSANVEVGDYRFFKVFEPKERLISAAPFKEQVLHHALMNICDIYFERSQIYDSYASRRGKGVYAAVERAKLFTRRYEWFLKLDVRKFFESISHEVLVLQLANRFKDRHIMSIFEQIIHSYEASPGRGVPIGNLTSQYFANHHLSYLDRLLTSFKTDLGYVRYMDDIVVWSKNKAELKEVHEKASAYLSEELRLDFKPFSLNRSSSGLPFLGYHVFPFKIRLLHKSRIRFIKKWHVIEDAYHREIWSEEKCSRKFIPLHAFIQHGNSSGFQKKVYEKGYMP